MKTKILLLLSFIVPFFYPGQIAYGQITDTNIVILTGAGSALANDAYTFNSGSPGAGSCWVPGFYNSGGGIYVLIDVGCGGPSTLWIAQNALHATEDYWTSNFPGGPWFTQTGGFVTNPPPNGTYLITWPSLVTSGLTNFFPMPGDSVTFSAGGRNMATAANPAALEVVFGTNVIFCSTPSGGTGALFSIQGRIQWDGTGVISSVTMDSGDPANPQTAQFNSYPSFSGIGNAGFQIIASNNAAGFALYSTIITAARATNQFNPLGIVQYHPGSVSLIITN